MWKFLDRVFKKQSEPEKFWVKFVPPDPTSITPTYCNLYGHLGEKKIGEATCYFQPGKPFTVETVKIDPTHRSKGYGSQMIEALRSEARKNSCTVFVFHGVDDKNHKAVALYKRLGAVAGSATAGKTDYEISPP